MSHTHSADEAAIREQAYYLWEQDGRPHGRDTEYWMRAVVSLSETPPAHAFPSAPPPKAKIKPKAKSAVAPKLAASKSKAGPAKTAKATEKKPKKK